MNVVLRYALFLTFALSMQADAGCKSYIFNRENSFSHHFSCTSSFMIPRYNIHRSVTEEADIEIFEFDAENSSFLCRRIDIFSAEDFHCFGGDVNHEMQFENSFGKFFILQRGKYHDFSSPEHSEVLLFRFPSGFEQEQYGCHVEFFESGNVYVYFDRGVYQIGECLLRLELNFSDNPGFLLMGSR
jgi:hypothetical protein